jgi:hypothetical protein
MVALVSAALAGSFAAWFVGDPVNHLSIGSGSILEINTTI